MKILLVQYYLAYRNYLLLIIFCIMLLLIRIKITSSEYFLFLIWNLFLAIIPLAITSLLRIKAYWAKNKWLFYGSFCIWLLFLPNAPYIITDLMHLKLRSAMAPWFDALMLSSFSLTGLALGLQSMNEMREILDNYFSRKISTLSIVLSCFLCGFGIYLGRFLRWNSWDILNDPKGLTLAILESLSSTHAWGVTMGFGTFLTLCFGLVVNTVRNKQYD